MLKNFSTAFYITKIYYYYDYALPAEPSTLFTLCM